SRKARDRTRIVQGDDPPATAPVLECPCPVGRLRSRAGCPPGRGLRRRAPDSVVRLAMVPAKREYALRLSPHRTSNVLLSAGANALLHRTAVHWLEHQRHRGSPAGEPLVALPPPCPCP